MSNASQITGEIQLPSNQFKAGRDVKNATVILKVPLKAQNVTSKQANVNVNQG